jgi:hypothetical protein
MSKKMCDSPSQNCGLAAAGPRDNEERALLVQDGLSLWRVQPLQKTAGRLNLGGTIGAHSYKNARREGGFGGNSSSRTGSSPARQ